MRYKARRALELLRLGTEQRDASFREGQEEAIRHVANGAGPLLLVQKTGWGKSNVYFIAVKLLREAGFGPALLISPLLALMRNQIEAAERMGVRAVTINSDNKDEWDAVEGQIRRDAIDVLLISPERLANERFVADVLAPIADRIALLVIDEAHCISDWGHDFRPDYRRIERTARMLPPNLRLLATTATASNRVLEDLQKVLGGSQDSLAPSLTVQRGDLNRPSLLLQSMRLPSQAERLAWLAQRLGEVRGSGIIYTLTVRDAEQVAAWLQSRGFAVEAYTGQTGERRPELEQALLDNRSQGTRSDHGARYGLRQARSVVRVALPGAGIGDSLLPAGGSCRPGAGRGPWSAAERRRRYGYHRLLRSDSVPDTKGGRGIAGGAGPASRRAHDSGIDVPGESQPWAHR